MATQWQRRRVGSALVGVVSPRGRARASIPRQRRTSAPVRTAVICPTCGLSYVTQQTKSGGLSGLDERALRILRASALEELARAVRAKAEPKDLRDIVRVIDRCDERLGG